MATLRQIARGFSAVANSKPEMIYRRTEKNVKLVTEAFSNFFFTPAQLAQIDVRIAA